MAPKAEKSGNVNVSQSKPGRQLKGVPPTFLVPLNITFCLLTISHIVSALYAPIQDCDETFNYWEPLHYVSHGYGLQTWEYSPEYSIRSWAYILLHFLPVKLATTLGKSKVFQFYLIRGLLAFVCSATETRLYSAISRTLNARIGGFYLVIVAFTPGFFHASTAFLPSSFAMYTSTLGLAAFMDWQGGAKTARGIMWFAFGALLGWPFAGALILPFVLEDWRVALLGKDMLPTFKRYCDGGIRAVAILVLQVAVDSILYRELVVVPWKIVEYNVFGGSGQGPDIFGTEPWHFYIRNLVLNFNLWFLLAIGAIPFLALQGLFFRQKTTSQTMLRTFFLAMPLYLWIGIFTLQPHKEERFMYPAYPFLALNAAISLHMVLSWFGSSDKRTLTGKIPAQIKLAFILAAVLLSINVGFLRIFGAVSGYRAPMQVYSALQELPRHPISPSPPSGSASAASINVCIGKEWYRFPSSFFLPDGARAKLIKSEFDGLLPGEFATTSPSSSMSESSISDLSEPWSWSWLSSWPGPGTWSVPTGMNDRNIEDPTKYTPIEQCTYLIDSHMPSTNPSALEPDHIGLSYSALASVFADAENTEGLRGSEWEKIFCAPFLDAASTGLVARTLWVPDLPFLPQGLRRVWGQYCLLRRVDGTAFTHSQE